MRITKRLIERARFELTLRRDPVSAARNLGVNLGSGCRILGLSVKTFGSEPYLVSIGDHVEITYGVHFVTHDGGVWVLRDRHPDLDVVAPIRVGNNVFIGMGSILLPGISIGDNVVVGAGSVVTRSVPVNSVAAGVPARVLCSLDEYAASSLAKNVGTKLLDPKAKRKRLQSLSEG